MDVTDSTAHWVPRAVLGCLAVSIFWSLLTVGQRPKGCPPGPPILPIVGNLLQLPKRDLHLAYQRWGQKYGPIFSLQLGTQTQIIITSGQVIKEMVDKKSNNYSDRPFLYMQQIWENSRIIMRSYDDLWKVERKLYHQFLNSNIAAKYLPYQSIEATLLCRDLMTRSGRFESHISRMTASLSSSMTYGFRINSIDDPNLKQLLDNAHGFFVLAHRYKLFDYYPKLASMIDYLPSALNPIRRKAEPVYEAERTFFAKLFHEAAKKSDSGCGLPCFAADILNAQKTWKDADLLTDKAASYIAGISFEGGTDTTKNTLIGFIKAMILFPEAQKLAQDEVDRVVGHDRLPNIDDYESLPYIRATIKETLRWMPTAISGAMPHAARKDDVYQEYTIPGSATITLAVWSCNNDPQLFEDPRVFNPKRQLVEKNLGEDAVASNYQQRSQWTFGAARRLCPGIHVADKTLFLAVARLLWIFNLERGRDGNGDVLPIDRDAVTQSIAACPMPFECEFIVRSDTKRVVLEAEARKTEALFDERGEYKQAII